jgi:hypothetical protein
MFGIEDGVTIDGLRRGLRRLASRSPDASGGQAWAAAFDRLSRSALTWEVAGHEGARGGAYTWQYSVRRRAARGPIYGATKLATRLDVTELLEVERAARRAIARRRWVILRGSVEWPLERQEAAARAARVVWTLDR